MVVGDVGGRVSPVLAIVAILAALLTGCGGDDGPTNSQVSEATRPSGGIAPAWTGEPPSTTEAPESLMAPTADVSQPELTPAGGEREPEGEGWTQPAMLPPNELGQVPILMYHQIGPEPKQFVRTPDQLRADLQWLYEHDFHVISMQDYLTGQIDIPAGKRPVILTFDDSPASQFRLFPLANGQLAIDPNSAVGILEAFYAAHPDFGRGGHFGVNGDDLFDWAPVADESFQTQYAGMKLRWLIEKGYEIGNHTLDHANLSKLTDDEIKLQLAATNDIVLEMAPTATMNVITLPYGMYPPDGNDTLLRGFEYEGRIYAWDAALLVGANPAASPFSSEFSPYETPRIQAFDDSLMAWFQTFEDSPDLLYVSDGDPNTVTVPDRTELDPSLVGTLDPSRVGDRQLIRD